MQTTQFDNSLIPPSTIQLHANQIWKLTLCKNGRCVVIRLMLIGVWLNHAYCQDTKTGSPCIHALHPWKTDRPCIIYFSQSLTHWGRVTHICVSKRTIIGSDNGLSAGRRQAIIIIWTNAGILLIGQLGTSFNGILIKIHIILFTKIHLKMSSRKWRPSCLGLNVLILCWFVVSVTCSYNVSLTWLICLGQFDISTNSRVRSRYLLRTDMGVVNCA